MLAIEDSALVLLAAGRSRRFNDGDKLAAPFLDKPLAYHVVTALEDLPFKLRIAVVSDTRLDFASLGYQVVENPDPSLGQARSLCFGVAEAQRAGATSILVALADMPRVTGSHVRHLFDTSEGADSMVASSDGIQPGPPALFGANHFRALLDLKGDTGGRELIRGGRHVVAGPGELVDIDTQEDLAALRKRYGLPTDVGLC